MSWYLVDQEIDGKKKWERMDE